MTTSLPFDESLRTRITRARDTAVAALLGERVPAGHWVGELSASALSTATAVTALTLVAQHDPTASAKLRPLIARGFDWLIHHQNSDGGWGDTTMSLSNISTTTLVWAALALPHESVDGEAECLAAAERWLARAAGSLAPAQLVRAIEQRYGDDRTFSIPILTMCALCGRLGPGAEGWRHVRALPFELAALPQSWFGALQLPVVSYALPALIAIGQVRHGLLPPKNPFTRALRNLTRARTLAKLEQLQPPNGGFLEATPLTSFVTMSLAALGHSSHPVVRCGVAFLTASARRDGSWPIDTNLATWVTTLAVNALGGDLTCVARRVSGGTGLPAIDEPSLRLRAGLPDAPALRAWLLNQQYREVHPYTLAAPGGWAWTDLPGGVPDADDTAGAILALTLLDPVSPESREAIDAGVRWLLDLQNRDGGIPTFCRGWGRLPFDRSSPDITAHALRAWRAAREHLSPDRQSRIDAASARALRFLQKTQRPDGAWVPLWFGHERDPVDENPLYGTARVVSALCACDFRQPGFERAVAWLVAKQNPDGGWCGAPAASGALASIEETSLALEALASAWPRVAERERPGVASALVRGAAWLADAIERDAWRTPAPIGFYFAKLWYHERLYPQIFAAAALNRLVDLSEVTTGK